MGILGISEASLAWAVLIAVVTLAYFWGQQSRTVSSLVESVTALTKLVSKLAERDINTRSRIRANAYQIEQLSIKLNESILCQTRSVGKNVKQKNQ